MEKEYLSGGGPVKFEDLDPLLDEMSDAFNDEPSVKLLSLIYKHSAVFFAAGVACGLSFAVTPDDADTFGMTLPDYAANAYRGIAAEAAGDD